MYISGITWLDVISNEPGETDILTRSSAKSAKNEAKTFPELHFQYLYTQILRMRF